MNKFNILNRSILYFLGVITILSLTSCQNKLTKTEEDFKIQDQPLTDEKQPYQVISNEQEAIALNNQTPEKSQEIEVQDRVFFSYDSFEISDESKKILDTQVSWLKNDEKIKITIEGHCDERGTREYNIALGEKRANSAKEYLVNNGINENSISIISYGKEKPAFFGNNEEIYAKNRRAVVVVD